MNLPHRLALIAAALVLLAQATHAGPKEAAQSAATGASQVATKVEKAVVHGVKAAASGVEKGAHTAGRAADNVARKVGLPPGAPASSARHVGPR